MHAPSRTALGFALGLACALAATPARTQSLASGFALETVVGEPFGGLPIGFAFLPDGRILVIEKDSGTVRVAAVGSGTSSAIGALTGLAVDGERGLLGIAVDPAWPQRPYVYLMATYGDGRSRITLHGMSGDLTQPASTDLVLGAPYTVLEYALDVFPNHKGGTLRFGPDAKLYASLGDDGSVCATQDVDAYNGKILRLDVAALPGAGSGPPPLADVAPIDNPYTGDGDAARLVFAVGLRNPFRFTIDAPTGNLYVGDVGAHAWEEVNEIEFAGFSGSNLGWPYYEGSMILPGTCTEGGPPFVAPIHAYAHAAPVPLAVIAGPRIRRVPASPYSFPQSYEGDVFFHDHYAGWIRRLVRSQTTWFPAAPVAGQPNAEDWATGIEFIADMQAGPDGALYLLVLVDGAEVGRGLHRIVHTPATDAPVAAHAAGALAVPNPARAGTGVTIRFIASRPAHAAATLTILDAGGRRVRRTSGLGAIHWDGRDARGAAVACGHYLYEIRDAAGVAAARGKVAIVR